MTLAASSFGSRHAVHVLTVLGPAVLMALLAGAADVHARWSRRGVTRRTPRLGHRPLVLAVAALSVVAAGVHVAVCPEHYEEHTLYGVFFTVAAATQLGWAVLLVATNGQRWLVRLGIAGNSAMIALWAVTRTVGLPFGPGAADVESVGALDVVATAAELGVIALATALLVSRHRDEHPAFPAGEAASAATAAGAAVVQVGERLFQ